MHRRVGQRRNPDPDGAVPGRVEAGFVDWAAQGESSRGIRLIFLLLVGALMGTAGANEARVVDPFEVLAAFDRCSAMELWPGFDATAFPIAIFDGERTLLFRHPSPPEEFQPAEGHEGVWAFAGKHVVTTRRRWADRVADSNCSRIKVIAILRG